MLRCNRVPGAKSAPCWLTLTYRTYRIYRIYRIYHTYRTYRTYRRSRIFRTFLICRIYRMYLFEARRHQQVHCPQELLRKLA
jgi:hypothetical protein